MKKRNFLKILIIVFILTTLITSSVYAWKVKTHVYAANLIIEDVKDGYVELPPYGRFKVNFKYQTLLSLYPDYYRAGALGPDLQPDIIIGQTIFHPGVVKDQYTAGVFIDKLWRAANNLEDYEPPKHVQDLRNLMSTTVFVPTIPPEDKSDPANKYMSMNNKDQALAYMLGFMAHAAGDYFGHSYINFLSEGTWPNMTDGLTQAEKDIIKRHSLIENFIDSKIPDKYKQKEWNKIASPQRFLFDNTLVAGNVNIDNMKNDNRYASIVGNTNGNVIPAYLDLFFGIRDACARRIRKIDENKDGDLIDQAAYYLSLQPVQKAYCKAWIEDIDMGLGEWIRANQNAAQRMLIEPNGMDAYEDEIKKWASKHVLSMLGVPDAAVTILNGIGTVTDFIAEIVPDRLEAWYKEVKEDILNFMIRTAFGIDIKEWKSLLNPPESLWQGSLFKSGTLEKLKAEMGNFNACTSTTDQDFIPFQNTLTFMKLILMGEEGIKELEKVAGANSTFYDFAGSSLTHFIQNMDYGYNYGVDEPLANSRLGIIEETRIKVAKVIFNLNTNIKKPSFSDMTKGPINVTMGYANAVSEIKVKYHNIPKNVNVKIGLINDSDFANKFANWQSINGGGSGEFSAFVPYASGKFHFRMYDEKGTLLAVSESIEVIKHEAAGASTPRPGNGTGTTPPSTPPPTETDPPQPSTPTPVDNPVVVDVYNADNIDLSKYRNKGEIILNLRVTGSTEGSVWGTDIYTDDSDICTAAVHAGVVKEGETKIVRITVLPNQDTYIGTIRNGIESYNYAEFEGSFKFTDAVKSTEPIVYTEGVDPKDYAGGILDSEYLYLEDYRVLGEAIINVRVTGSNEGSVWGTNIYTDDSDINTAAVHAGIVKLGETKVVKITLVPGTRSYVGTEKNGIESYSYPEFEGSFKFTDAKQTANEPVAPEKQFTNIGAYVIDEGVRISWQSKNGAIGYRLFRVDSENNRDVSVTDFYITDTSYIDVNLDPDTTYYYIVKPVLVEANPVKGKEEVLGDEIARYTIKTDKNIVSKDYNKKYIILQIENPLMSVNGIKQEIDPGRGTTPIVSSSRSMVPIRVIVEAMGGTVMWDNATKKITLMANGNIVEMWVDKKEITVNGVKRSIDIAPFVKNGRTYVPVRFAAENLNAEVNWLNSTREAIITFE